MQRSLITAPLLLVLTLQTPAAAGQQSSEGRTLRAGRLLTNDSIVRLVKAGVDDETILHMVDTQPGKYSLGVDDVIRLKQAGVSDEVLDGMLSQSARGNSAADASPPVQVFVTPPSTGNSSGQAPGQPPVRPGGPPNQAPVPPGPQPEPARQAGVKGSAAPPGPQGARSRAYHYGAGDRNATQKQGGSKPH